MSIYDLICFIFFFFKQKTAYEMRISDWSSDVCSSDLEIGPDFQSQHRDSFRASLLIEPTETLSNYTVFDYAKVNEEPGALITSDVAATAGCFPDRKSVV